MNEPSRQDEMLLIDYLLGRTDEPSAGEVRRRLEADPEFRRLHSDLQNTLKALGRSADVEPPEDLVDRTMARIRSARQTEALLVQQGLSRRGGWPTFSLRELGAIAAAALLLVAIFVPAVRQSKSRTLLNECYSNVGQIGSALQTFANEHHSLPASAAQRQRWLAREQEPAVSNSVALFRLVRSEYASPVRFQCPAVGGGSFVAQAGMVDFPAGRFINYSYQHAMGSEWMRANAGVSLAGVARQMAILADATPVFCNGRFDRDRVHAPVSDNHARTGQNVLYLDMHVDWTEQPTVGVNGNNIYLAEGILDYSGDEAPVNVTDSFLLPAYSFADASSSR